MAWSGSLWSVLALLGKAGLEGSGVARSDPARLGKARQAWFGGAALGMEWSVKAG